MQAVGRCPGFIRLARAEEPIGGRYVQCAAKTGTIVCVRVCVHVGRQLISQEALFSFLFSPLTNHNNFDAEAKLLSLVSGCREAERQQNATVTLHEPQTSCVTGCKPVP